MNVYTATPESKACGNRKQKPRLVGMDSTVRALKPTYVHGACKSTVDIYRRQRLCNMLQCSTLQSCSVPFSHARLQVNVLFHHIWKKVLAVHFVMYIPPDGRIRSERPRYWTGLFSSACNQLNPAKVFSM
eukprot:jgi/Botrbrau1/1337/Bobra.0063s0048.1